MTKSVRRIEQMEKQEAIRLISKNYTPELVNKIIGSGEKKLADAESENYCRTNRSIHALIELKKGTVITERNCALLRTEKILRPGISPLFLKEIMGKTVKSDIPDGEGIRWQDII